MKADFGIIGGSGTWGAKFPEDFPELGLRVIKYLGEQDTPSGKSAPFKLLGYKNFQGLYVGMHGAYPSKHEATHPLWASQQVAWVFKKHQVPWVITGGSVGGIQALDGSDLPPWSVLIPSDFFTWPTLAYVPPGRIFRPTGVSEFYRLNMPFCPILSKVLYNQTIQQKTEGGFPKVEIGGVYACTPMGRFETEQEIKMLKMLGGHVVGQTVGLEAIALRNAQIPVASLNIVSNYAEENDRWIGDKPNSMAEFYKSCPKVMAKIISASVNQILDESIVPSSMDSSILTDLDMFPVLGA